MARGDDEAVLVFAEKSCRPVAVRHRRGRRLRWWCAGLAVLLAGSACTGGSRAPDASAPQRPSTPTVQERLEEVARALTDFSGAVLVARGDEVLLSRG